MEIESTTLQTAGQGLSSDLLRPYAEIMVGELDYKSAVVSF